ncbi:cyclic nucleotide-gated ion channel 1-like isoform X2 [Rosa rugosa]|nr:cyclic nucleotide-gated ion channel 1-like isoform X2 [Rosa rugosa]XP_062017556.1 cyclic nucleotide-gated ion channel 1-like isoform X2 [Rosa rugosa]XP_062017557.1 cyclic nucleotide-gated ion channel 1-like isoform X2 [Rosa rugosa]
MVLFPPLQLLDNSGHDGIFGVSCMLYLFLDPLFLYAPLINEQTKCVVLDNRVKIAALVLRSFGDVCHLIRIYLGIKDGWGKFPSLRKKLRLANDMVSILPIPQVAILIFFPNMRGSNSLKIMTFLNSLVALQYLLRVYPIYVLFNEIINTENICDRRDRNPKWLSIVVHSKWLSIVVNMIGYIIASHIFGAFWYFFSIQREIQCWEHACRMEIGCEFSTSCVQNTHRNITKLLNKHCPVNPLDKQVFDFGVFQDALQSGMQRSTNFSQKFLQCLSWGIRNMSSFGSNLSATSTDGGENVLVVVFSICGLGLFMYLLGHVQTFMQKVSKSYTIQQKMKMTNIRSILNKYGLSDENHEMERKIKLAVKHKLEEDDSHIVEDMFSILSLRGAENLAMEIKCSLFMDKLKKVDGLKDKGKDVLKKICEHFEPMIYSKGCYIIREGEPLDMMFFVTRGSVLTYATNNGGSNGSSGTIQLEIEKDGLYGKELLTWAEGCSSKLSNLPISTITVKSHNKVEVFALLATDLQRVVSNFPSQFNMGNILNIAVDNEMVN